MLTCCGGMYPVLRAVNRMRDEKIGVMHGVTVHSNSVVCKTV
jgi:hypothetical protein